MTEEKETLRKRGIRISKNESVLDAIRSGIPHWIHETVDDASYIGGKKYLRECTCSECGFKVSFERQYCPHCGVKMVKF